MSDAVIGLLGVALGGLIAIAKEFIVGWTERQRVGRYAAMRIVCVLDEFIERCVWVVLDDGTSEGEPAGRSASGELYCYPVVDQPDPPRFPDDIDWTSIDADLMYRILALPNLARQTEAYISSEAEHSYPPDHDPIFNARWEGYANLGLEAIFLADKLRHEFKLPQLSIEMRDPNWDAGEFFRKKKLEIKNANLTSEKLENNMLDELGDVSKLKT